MSEQRHDSGGLREPRVAVMRRDASARFNDALRKAMKGTVWTSGCRSWYLDKNGNPATWPWTFDRFREDMSAPRLEEFEFTGDA